MSLRGQESGSPASLRDVRTTVTQYTLNFHCGHHPTERKSTDYTDSPKRPTILWSSDLVHQNHLGVVNTRMKGVRGRLIQGFPEPTSNQLKQSAGERLWKQTFLEVDHLAMIRREVWNPSMGISNSSIPIMSSVSILKGNH